MSSCPKLSAAVVTALVIGASARVASAQYALVTDTITDETYDASALSALEGHGYELSHGVILRPSMRLEGGGTNNVFYTGEDASPTASGIVRLAGALYVTNDRPRVDERSDDESDDATPPDYEFRGGMQLAYLEFLSPNSAVRDQRQFNVAGDANLVGKPAGPWSFIIRDLYRRDTRSSTFEDTSTLNRNDNRLFLGCRFQSDGGGLSVTVHYENRLQLFENAESVALPSRMNHTTGVGGRYDLHGDQRTTLLVDMSYGFFRTWGQTNTAEFYKTNSQPLRVVVGVVHEISSNIVGKAEAGFAHASYGARSDGRSAGYDAPVAAAELGVRWTSTGRLLARYRYDHFDSSSANFYRDHELELKLVQQLGFVVLDGGPEIRFRQYSGMPMQIGADLRDDTIVSVRARLQAVLAERYSLSLEYRLSRVSTNYVQAPLDAMGSVVIPSYGRHDVVAGLTVAY
jgi:hypothetical protein